MALSCDTFYVGIEGHNFSEIIEIISALNERFNSLLRFKFK